MSFTVSLKIKPKVFKSANAIHGDFLNQVIYIFFKVMLLRFLVKDTAICCVCCLISFSESSASLKILRNTLESLFPYMYYFADMLLLLKDIKGKVVTLL